MRAEYNILEKMKWKSLAEEKDCLLGAKDKEIKELKSQLLKAKEESVEVDQLRARVSGLEATENSLRSEVTSTKEHNVLLEQECDSLKLKVTSLESTIAEKDHEPFLGLMATSSSLKSQNQSLVNQVQELETSSTDLREKLEMYEGSLKQLEEFQDNLMRPLETRLAEIDADFTRCCMRFFKRVSIRTSSTSMQRRKTSGEDGEKSDERLLFLKTYLVSTIILYPLSFDSAADVFPKNVTPRPEGEEKVDASTGGDLAFSKLDDEAEELFCSTRVLFRRGPFNLYDPPRASVTSYGPPT
ncbi:hypothetical protein Tco_0797460 [Tanacetum coccineum]